MKTNVQNEPLHTLIDRFAEAASAYGKGFEACDSSAANAAQATVARLYREIRRRGPDAQQELLRLANHPDPGVRCMVGAHALEFAPMVGERLLVAIEAAKEMLLSTAATMALQEWREGNVAMSSPDGERQ